MEKEFVPYELAVKLKELGFDGFEVFGYYNLIEYSEKWAVENRINPDSVDYLEAPLWQQAFDWFREKYNLISVIGFQNNYGYSYEIYRIKSKDCVEYIDGFGTYEEARQACLEKLIEIVEDERI